MCRSRVKLWRIESGKLSRHKPARISKYHGQSPIATYFLLPLDQDKYLEELNEFLQRAEREKLQGLQIGDLNGVVRRMIDGVTSNCSVGQLCCEFFESDSLKRGAA